MEEKYVDFVTRFLSEESKDSSLLEDRYNDLEALDCDIVGLDVCASGMSAEAGEFMEIIKKLKFQGKPWTGSERYHLIRELGDVLFYVAAGCKALGISLEEVEQINRDKLENRYTDGKFTVDHSENRKVGDI